MTYPLESDALVAYGQGLKGDPGDVSTAQLDAAIAALKGAVTTANDTLAKIEGNLSLKAPLDSPNLTGNPTAPTQAVSNNSTKLANTAYADRVGTNLAAVTQPVNALLTSISALSATVSGVLQFASGVASVLTLDTDPTLAANSNTRLATQAATKAYADGRIAANDALVYKGAIDCSANPNYPAADAGHFYKVSVAGKIGGASGINVEVGDNLLCTVDGSAAGNQATVGANWDIIQGNLDGAVIGPASSVNGNVPKFSGTTGKLLVDSGKALPSGAIVGDTDAQTLASKTLTTPVINGLPTGTGVATANTASTLVARDGSGNFSAGTITAALSGNATTATTATTATNANNAAITNDTTTNATRFLVWSPANSGNNALGVTSTKLTCNPSTGDLGAISVTAGAGGVKCGGVLSFTAQANVGTGPGFSWSTGDAFLVAVATNGMQINNQAGSVALFTMTNAGVVALSAQLGLKSYTVATLPTGTTGQIVYCSNVRVFNGAGVQEGAGAGTGGTVGYNGSAWKISGTNVTAAA